MFWSMRTGRIPFNIQYREWLESVINSTVSYGYSELVLSDFLRVVTHARILKFLLHCPARFASQVKLETHRMLFVLRLGRCTGRYSWGVSSK